MRVVLLAVLALAGCQTAGESFRPAVASCPFEGPEYVVEATTSSGQLWVDETIEVGVRVCGWPRPK